MSAEGDAMTGPAAVVAAAAAAALLAAGGCAGAGGGTALDRPHGDIRRDYVVVDASSPSRPGWTDDPGRWARENGLDTAAHRHLSFETTPKNDRAAACELARARVRADVASEVATEIDRRLTAFLEGRPAGAAPGAASLREYVETTLVERVRARVHGVEVLRTYWEKRRHRRDLGARSDHDGWTCAVFARMDARRLGRLVEDAADRVGERAGGGLGDEVREALRREAPDA